MDDLAGVDLRIDHLDQLGGQLLILQRGKYEEPVRRRIGHHHRALLRPAAAHVAFLLGDLDAQHLIDVTLHLVGPGELEHVGLRDRLVRHLGLDLGDEQIDERKLVSGGHDHQRVGGGLGERARLHLAPPLHRSHAAQEHLDLDGDLRGVEHLQVVHLDLELVGVLRVDLREQLLDLLELLRRSLDDQRVVVDRDVNLFALRLAAPNSAVAEHVVDHVPRFPRVGVLELDRDDVVVLDLDVELRDHLAHVRQDRLGRENDQPVRPRVGRHAEPLRSTVAPSSRAHTRLNEVLHGAGNLRRVDVLKLEELGLGDGDRHQILEFRHQRFDLLELIGPGPDQQRVGRRIRVDRDVPLAQPLAGVEVVAQLAGQVVDVGHAGQHVRVQFHFIRGALLVDLRDKRFDLLHLLRRGTHHQLVIAHGAEGDLLAAARGALLAPKRGVEHGLHFPGGGVLQREHARRNRVLLGGLVELGRPRPDVREIVFRRRDDQCVGVRLGADLHQPGANLVLQHAIEHLGDRVGVGGLQRDGLDLRRLVVRPQVLDHLLDARHLILHRRNDDRLADHERRYVDRRLLTVAAGIERVAQVPGELVERASQAGQLDRPHDGLVAAELLQLVDQGLDFDHLLGRRDRHHVAARDQRELDLLARRLVPAPAAHERVGEGLDDLPWVRVLQRERLALTDRLARAPIEIRHPGLDLLEVLGRPADDQRVGERLDADRQRLVADLLVEDRAQDGVDVGRVGVFERERL